MKWTNYSHILFVFVLLSSDALFAGTELQNNLKPTSPDNSKCVKLFCPQYPVKIYREDGDASATFIVSKNTLLEEASSIQLSGHYNLGLMITRPECIWDVGVHSDLGYRYYFDSLWSVTENMFSVDAFRLSSPDKKINPTCIFQLNSPLLNSYSMMRNANDSYRKINSGGFFNPGEFQISYGYSWRFWKYSIINFSLASIKLQSLMIYKASDDPSGFGLYERHWQLDYGGGVNIHILHDFLRRFRWDNQTRIFFNSLDKEAIRIELSNRLRYRLYGPLAISANSRISYLPVVYSKVQIRQEIRLGFEWTLSPN